MPGPARDVETRIIAAAEALVGQAGLSGLTVERLAAESGISRMTLHRRGISRSTVVDALVQRAAEAYVTAVWPALTAAGTAAERLGMALDAICAAADDNLALLAGLFAEADSPFHRTGDGDTDRETNDLFVGPLARLLRDGVLDASLATSADPEETAAVVFNLVGWGYVHLRHSQGWPPSRARPAVTAFALAALEP